MIDGHSSACPLCFGGKAWISPILTTPGPKRQTENEKTGIFSPHVANLRSRFAKRFNQFLTGDVMRKELVLTIMVFAAMLSIPFLTGCGNSSQSLGAASRQVQQTITYDVMKDGPFSEGKLKDGTAVLVRGLGAYWVKNGRVYAINGFAKQYSSGISYGPTGMTKSDVQRAIAGR